MGTGIVKADTMEGVRMPEFAPPQEAPAPQPAVVEPVYVIHAAGIAKIAGAIAAIMNEIGIVAKTGNNTFQHYKYAKMETILQELTPLLSAHGIIILQSELGREMFDDGRAVAIRYGFTIVHSSGEVWPDRVEQSGMSRCRDSKGGFDDKALAKCHTAARKYFLLALFQIPTGDVVDNDGDGERTTLPKKNARGIYEKMQREIDEAPDIATLKSWGEDAKERIATLPEDWQDILRLRFQERLVELRQHPPKAQTEPTEARHREIEERELPGASASKPSQRVEAPHKEWLVGGDPADHDEDGVIWDDVPVEQSKWSALSYAQQSGIRCNDPVFWKFIDVSDALNAVHYVRQYCGVKSRNGLLPNTEAGRKWHALDNEFIAWKHDADLPTAPPSPAAAAGAEDEGINKLAELMRLDKQLAEAALGGTSKLKNTWEKIAPADQAILKAALDGRHKPAATEADERDRAAGLDLSA